MGIYEEHIMIDIYTLNNVKIFIISKKEAFKVGCGPTEVKSAVIGSLYGGAIRFTITLVMNVIRAVIAAIRIGEQQEWLEEIKKFCNEEDADFSHNFHAL